MKNLSHVKPAYKGKNFAIKRNEMVLGLAEEIAPIMNELHDKDYSFEYWLALLKEHLKVCANRKPYLLEDSYSEPVLKFPINSWYPLRKKEIMQAYVLHILRAIKYRKDVKEELNKIYNNKNLLIGQRAQELEKHIDGVKISPMFIWGIFFKKGNKSKRRKLKVISEKIDNLFLKKILLSMPSILVEHYDYINDHFEVKSPQEKRFHVEHGDSFLSSFIMAKYREKGAKIISYQGGGFFGEQANHPSKESYILIDEFHTYGWKGHEKDVPDRPYRLIEYQRLWDKNRSPSNELYKNKILVCFSIINKVTIKRYLNFSETFFSKIPEDLFKNIIARPRPKSIKFDKKAEAKTLKIPKDITIDGGKDKMAKSAAKVELVILTSLPATNFLECIYVGQPVIAVNTNKSPSELFSKYVPHLERLGVIHKTPLSLTEYLLNIEDYSKWWEKIEQDEVFQEFSSIFAGKQEFN